MIRVKIFWIFILSEAVKLNIHFIWHCEISFNNWHSITGSHTCINTGMALVFLLLCVSGWTTLFEYFCDKTFVERAKTDTGHCTLVQNCPCLWHLLHRCLGNLSADKTIPHSEDFLRRSIWSLFEDIIIITSGLGSRYVIGVWVPVHPSTFASALIYFWIIITPTVILHGIWFLPNLDSIVCYFMTMV